MPDDPRQLYAAKATQALAARARAPRRPVEFRSQCGEDALLWELLQGQLTGFYIEVGAFNGFDLSPTYAYDCIGWDGLLIEAIPDRARDCAANRPNARVVHAALGPYGSSGTTSFTVTTDSHGAMLSHLTSTTGHGEPGAVTSQQEVTVPYTTMDALLDDPRHPPSPRHRLRHHRRRGRRGPPPRGLRPPPPPPQDPAHRRRTRQADHAHRNLHVHAGMRPARLDRLQPHLRPPRPRPRLRHAPLTLKN